MRISALPEPDLLLDTHAFAWWLSQPARLGSTARSAITTAAECRVMVSVVSIWEMGMKFRRGRWSEIEAILNDPAGCIVAEGMVPLPVTLSHARAAGLLDWDHGDPFDRMLAAQAIAEQAILVTADRAFAFVPTAAGLRTLWG